MQPKLLPVVKNLKEAYKIWQSVLPHIPKGQRQTIGVQVDNLFLNALQDSFEATYATGNTKKHKLVSDAVVSIDKLKFFLLVAWECRALNNKQYIRVSESLIEANKMLVGWRDYLRKKTPTR